MYGALQVTGAPHRGRLFAYSCQRSSKTRTGSG